MKKSCCKRINVSIVLTAALLFGVAPAHGAISWVSRNDGLSSYKPQTISVDPSDARFLYLGTRGLLFKSADEGLSWKALFKIPQANSNVNVIRVHPADSKRVLAGSDTGLFLSSDYGKQWRRVYSGMSNIDGAVFDIHIDISDPNTIYAGTGSGLIVSGDRGETWSRKAGLLSNKAIRSIAQHSNDTGTFLFAADSALFRSTDNCRTFSRVFSLSSLISDSEEAYIEEGAEEIESNGRLRHVIITGTFPYGMYLATTRGIYASNDTGNTWKLMADPAILYSDVRELAASHSGEGFLFAATDRGVLRYSESNGRWTDLYSGLTTREASSIELTSSGQAMLWAATPKGVYSTKGDLFEIADGGTGGVIHKIMNNFTDEPVCFEVQQAAIRYAEVYPEKIEMWRKGARAKGFFPKVSVGFDHDTSDGLHWDAGANPDTWVLGPEDRSTGWDVSASWDLGDIVWSNDQTTIDVRSKLMVQLRNDIVNEVTRIYFERRKVQIELFNDPPADDREFIEKDLRLQELTADIDGMTGGWFSVEIAKRRQS